MIHTFSPYPFNQYLSQGISAQRALELMRQHDCLTFPQLQSGLFPAANFDDLEMDGTGMANAWLRDSACIGLALLKCGQRDLAYGAVTGVISRLELVADSFRRAIISGTAPENDRQRPPVRFAGQESLPRYDWANAQNDAIGYALLLIGEAVTAALLEGNEDTHALVMLIIDYLAAIEYWNDLDSGHWEEVKKLNASSVGTVIAGLKSVRSIAPDANKLEVLIAKGDETLQALLPLESSTPGMERRCDAAQIFLIEPQGVISDDMARQIISNVSHTLLGEHGIRRYEGDSYWGPDYREHFLLSMRAADFSNPEDMALRDSYLTRGDEAQWTLFDPMIAIYYARCYQQSGKEEDALQANRFMSRSLRCIVEHQTQRDGSTVWRIPELFFKEQGEWVPNDHLGLLWAQANLLQALVVYKKVFGNKSITAEAEDF